MRSATAVLHEPGEVFNLVGRAQRQRRGVALVTVVGLTGSSVRSLGTHMGIVDDGRHAGSFSGGCVEAAVIAEAQRSIDARESRVVRFGRGSPYVDIRLPCGGGVDLLFLPDPPEDRIAAIEQRLKQRQPVSFTLSTSEPRLTVGTGPGSAGAGYHVSHPPRLKLLIFGHGAESLALARLALTFGADVELLTPEASVVTSAKACGGNARLLETPACGAIDADGWTAVVLLFHDHDWEPPLLAQALATPAFFIGAMGSKGTHEARLERLRSLGFNGKTLERVRGPIGLMPSARDPQMLALSTLAQVAGEYRKLTA